MEKLWGGRFTKATAADVEALNASIGFDYRLAEYDIQGSLAHVRGLYQAKVITDIERDQLMDGLQVILKKIKAQEVEFRVADEDIHMNIERLLHEEIGDIAGKLHTGRSRNDQVALDCHLYVSDVTQQFIQKLTTLQTTLIELAEAHIDTIMPGYTHLQRALPVRFAHHLLAYFWMFQRDKARLQDSLKRSQWCPLGAGALAGSAMPIDRHYVASQLNYSFPCNHPLNGENRENRENEGNKGEKGNEHNKKNHLPSLYHNSLDAVSDRDFIVEFLSAAALIMTHLSRLSEELILWASSAFGFITLDDAYCTGSSMMPQKKNPDIAELCRGKTGRVYGALMALLTTLKALPLAYNKDMQEDKPGLFDVVDTVGPLLNIFNGMLATMTVHADAMAAATEADFMNATAVANYLTEQGMTFRKAHAITGQLVRYCIEHGYRLETLPLETYQALCPLFSERIYEAIRIEAVVERHAVVGGTAREAVLDQLGVCKQLLS